MASAAEAKKCRRLSQCCFAPLPNKSQVGFMHECRGIERLSGLLMGQLLRRQPPQFSVDQRQ